MNIALTAMTPDEISTELEIKPFQGRQIFQWIHQKKEFDYEKMSNLSKELRTKLKENHNSQELRLVQVSQSEGTGTKKVLLKLKDGETVESVLIRDKDRITLCLSSQVGCPLKCSFCATGAAGFERNLSAGEIVEQALFLLKGEELKDRTPNIVFMGMGEPFRNYDAVIKSIHLLMDKNGLNIGARKITVSTAGEAKMIEKFADEDWQVRLSISLHAANDELRSQLVPLNKKYNLNRLKDAIMNYQLATDRQVTFEWTLLYNVNDRALDTQELLNYLKGIKASVNLIPWNPVAGLPYKPSPANRCEAFRQKLEDHGVPATLRKEKGQDIDAACGQLRRIHADSAVG